jgi:2-polyprenyl-3-methyl-5-hydroxy-6-metoxy-1,4-benzoquinol methylase
MSPIPQAVPFSSSLCHQHHFALDQYRWWAKAMKEQPLFYRKQWEFVFIAQVLFERGMLKPGKRGLGFGVGTEPLPSLFASFGAEVVATDQSLDTAIAGGWVSTNQHTIDLSGLNTRGICTDRMIQELASFRAVDMNDIDRDLDGKFDFCWSACAFEHLGSLQHGADFVINSIRTLKPGGLAVHTTEFNITSDTDTYEDVNLSIYRRQDIGRLVADLEAKGYEVEPIDWALGDGFAELVVDLPPFGRGEPHIRLRAAQYDCTSIGLIIRKPE